MHFAHLRQTAAGNADRLADVLSDQQFLKPHQPVADALAAAAEQLELCPEAVEYALRTLQVEPARSIGRLRRTELMQLAGVISRIHGNRGQFAVENSPSSYPT